jgi:integrase
MGRRRTVRKRGWPANLYERGGYYSWRDPITKREYGLGRDQVAAFAEAAEANVHVAGISQKTRLVDRITGDADRSLGALMDLYEKRQADVKLAVNTRASYATLQRKARALLGEGTAVARIATLQVDQAIQSLIDEGKHRTAQAMRSRLADIFRFAVAKGWCTHNPVLVTEKIKVEIIRSRLTFDVFMRLYEATGIGWLRNAMALALVSGQRREDISLARFAAVKDGHWFCEQGKTGQKLMLPLELRLAHFGMSLGDVVRQCRTSGTLSKYLVHHLRSSGGAKAGDLVWKDTISRTFTEELKKVPGLKWGDKDPPTFHEIRSLSERMYRAQGGVDTQELLGHRDPKSTRLYHDNRGAEWVRVKVG